MSNSIKSLPTLFSNRKHLNRPESVPEQHTMTLGFFQRFLNFGVRRKLSLLSKPYCSVIINTKHNNNKIPIVGRTSRELWTLTGTFCVNRPQPSSVTEVFSVISSAPCSRKWRKSSYKTRTCKPSYLVFISHVLVTLTRRAISRWGTLLELFSDFETQVERKREVELIN